MSFLIRFYNFASHKENIYTIMSTSKHPKGLYLVFATSTAERFSYYGMRAGSKDKVKTFWVFGCTHYSIDIFFMGGKVIESD